MATTYSGILIPTRREVRVVRYVDYRDPNNLIAAHVGTIVRIGEIGRPDYTIDLWCDDEALLMGDPQFNELATILANGYPVHGPAVMICTNRMGESRDLPFSIVESMLAP